MVKTIDIRPEVAMYSAFARLNYTPWHALAEFVDNSLQSYLANKRALRKADGSNYTLRVDISIDDGLITIIDNAAGIAERDFGRAFRPAAVPPDRTGLSEFGLGMKAAACWFAKEWSVRTSALGETVRREVYFDVPQISTSGLDKVAIVSRKEAKNRHYTHIVLKDLNHQPRTKTIGKIKSHLASIFRKFILSGELLLWVGDDMLSYEEPEMLVAPHYKRKGKPRLWRKDISVVLDNGAQIEGWAGLLDKGSAANAGFAIFRRKRLIQGSVGTAYRPEEIFGKSNSFVYQRLVGEINVKGFSVSHTKDGVQWYELEEEITKRLKKELDKGSLPLIQQALHYRKGRTASPPTTMHHAAQDATANVVQSLPPVVDEQLSRSPDNPPSPPRRLTTPKEGSSKSDGLMKLEHAGRTWRISVQLENGAESDKWIRHSFDPRKTRDRIVIRINTQFPFQKRFATPDHSELIPFTRIGAALAIAEITARESDVPKAGIVRQNFDELLRALSGPVGEYQDD